MTLHENPIQRRAQAQLMLPLALSNSSAARCFISREKLRKASCNTQTFTIIAYPHYFYLLSNNISHMEDSSLSST